MFTLLVAGLAADSPLSRPSGDTRVLSNYPGIYLTDDLWNYTLVEHVISKLPNEEKAWTPCIGQVNEFSSKRCTILPVSDDMMESALKAVSNRFNVDVQPLLSGGFPIIRYLPGAPQVPVHGDRGANGLIPNATLVVYLTDAYVGEKSSGQTFFPDLDIEVTPSRGSVLSFENVDRLTGKHIPTARHGVRAISQHAGVDRLVVQIPLVLTPGMKKTMALPEHVSGNKHTIHLGMMGVIFVVTVGYYLWDTYFRAHPLAAYDPNIHTRL